MTYKIFEKLQLVREEDKYGITTQAFEKENNANKVKRRVLWSGVLFNNFYIYL